MKKSINIKNNKGFVAIDTIISMTALVLLLVFAVMFCAYEIPKIRLENEAQSLIQIAKVQGGLTNFESVLNKNNDIDNFKKQLEKAGFKDVNISLVTQNGKINAIGVAPIKNSKGFYIPRSILDPMVLNISVKPKITQILFYKMPNYKFTEKVISERN